MKEWLRIILIESAEPQKRTDFVVRGRDLKIGRPDPLRADSAPDIDFSFDPTCSRKHARLWFENGTWYLADEGSKHGTSVAGKSLNTGEATELSFLTPVKTGQTTWAILPADYWFGQFGRILIGALLAAQVNYAAHHSGLPLVQDLRVANTSDARLRPLTVTLDIPGYAANCRTDCEPLEAGEARRLKVPPISLDGTALRAQIEPTRAQWRIEIELDAQRADAHAARAEGTRRIFSATKELIILGYWDWTFAPDARKTIAVFSTPRNPAIERAVQEAQRLPSHEQSEWSSFRELLRGTVMNPERVILSTLYDYLRHEWEIRYEDPKSVRGVSDTFQTIRSAHRILPNVMPRLSSATCIDLALLFAACLENVGLCPVIIFLGKSGQQPRHAMIGVWSGTTAGPYSVSEDADFIRAEVNAGRLFVVECTGVTRGAAASGDKLLFDAAEQGAKQALEQAEWICAVDIMNLRPPAGRIMPLENPYEPEVARIFDLTRQIAVMSKSRNMEMVHLLYAVILSNGEAAQVIDRMAVDRDLVRRMSGLESEAEPQASYPPPTANLVECRQLAQSFARHQESPAVREQDLLWALLQKAPHSSRLVEACIAMHFDLELFRRHLANIYPSPLLDSTGTYTSILVSRP